MRYKLLISCLLVFIYSVQAQKKQPVKAVFKTANQAAKEDSIEKAVAPVYTKPNTSQVTRHYDTASWGLLTIAGLVLVKPMGDLAQNTSNGLGYGFNVGCLVNPARRRNPFRWERKKANIYVGATMGYLQQGGIRQFYASQNAVGQSSISSIIINKMITGDLVLRLEVLPGPIKLFVEGNYGGSFFNGYQDIIYDYNTIADPNTNIRAEFLPNKNQNWLPHYAYGGGFRTGNEVLKMEFKVMNQIGNSVQYIDATTMKYDASANTYSYSYKKTATNMLLPQMTVSYLF